MESAKMGDVADASVVRARKGFTEDMLVKGQYYAECFGPDGTFKWNDTVENIVTTVGKNLVLDTVLNGAAYTVTGPFMGLVSSLSYSSYSTADTMAAHPSWLEAGASPNYPIYAARLTASGKWPASSAGAVSFSTGSTCDFTISSTGGTVKGCFMVMGTNAVATIANTSGVLYSVGLFTGGDKILGVGDVIKVSYTSTLT